MAAADQHRAVAELLEGELDARKNLAPLVLS